MQGLACSSRAAAEFERELIRERVTAVFRRDQALKMQRKARAIARRYGVGLATVMRALKEGAYAA